MKCLKQHLEGTKGVVSLSRTSDGAVVQQKGRPSEFIVDGIDSCQHIVGL